MLGAQSKKPNKVLGFLLESIGADDRNRTEDIRITNAQKMPFIGID